MRSFGFTEELLASGVLPWSESSEGPAGAAPEHEAKKVAPGR
jgi:hypothetical protein